MTGNPWARLSLFSGVIWGIILRDRVGRFPARGTSVHCGSAWSGQIHRDLRPRGALLVEFKGGRRLTFWIWLELDAPYYHSATFLQCGIMPPNFVGFSARII